MAIYFNMFVCLHVCPVVCLVVCLCLSVSACDCLCPSVSICAYLCVSAGLYPCLAVSVCVCLCLSLSARVRLCLTGSACLRLCLPVVPSVCPSPCFSVYLTTIRFTLMIRTSLQIDRIVANMRMLLSYPRPFQQMHRSKIKIRACIK